MEKIYLATLESRNFTFKAVGTDERSAKQTLIDGLAVHTEQRKLNSSWWDHSDINTEPLKFGSAYRDDDEIPANAEKIDLSDMTFTHEGHAISNPTLSECGRFEVSPEYYGFTVEWTGGGCTAWNKRVGDKWVVLTDCGCSHELGKVGSIFMMGFYDDAEDGENLWGNYIDHIEMQVGISVTSEDEIDDMAEDALNALCLSVQKALGVTDGGLASMHFSDDETKDAIKAYIKAELKAKLDEAIANTERGE
jgi:hypothetical protein